MAARSRRTQGPALRHGGDNVDRPCLANSPACCKSPKATRCGAFRCPSSPLEAPKPRTSGRQPVPRTVLRGGVEFFNGLGRFWDAHRRLTSAFARPRGQWHVLPRIEGPSGGRSTRTIVGPRAVMDRTGVDRRRPPRSRILGASLASGSRRGMKDARLFQLSEVSIRVSQHHRGRSTTCSMPSTRVSGHSTPTNAP